MYIEIKLKHTWNKLQKLIFFNVCLKNAVLKSFALVPQEKLWLHFYWETEKQCRQENMFKNKFTFILLVRKLINLQSTLFYD